MTELNMLAVLFAGPQITGMLLSTGKKGAAGRDVHRQLEDKIGGT